MGRVMKEVPEPSTEGNEHPIDARLEALARRIDELETRDQNRGRALLLSVVAIYAVLASLLMLHWAGHYFTQNP